MGAARDLSRPRPFFLFCLPIQILAEQPIGVDHSAAVPRPDGSSPLRGNQDPVPFDDVPAFIAQRRNAGEKPAIFAVGGTAEPQLVLEWLPSGGRSAVFFSVQIDVFRVNNTSLTFGIGFGY